MLQGLTEFLPVSSSGHLSIKTLFGIETEDASFEIVVHLATVLSTIVVFRKELWEMVSDTLRFRTPLRPGLHSAFYFRQSLCLLSDCFSKEKVETLFSGGLTIVGWMLLLTAVLLMVSQWGFGCGVEHKLRKSVRRWMSERELIASIAVVALQEKHSCLPQGMVAR